MRALRHASILAVEQVVIEPGQLVLITEPADLPDLRRLLADHDGVLPAEQAGRIGAQIASALAAGFAVGITHLDLRPDNILVASVRPLRIKINGFGLAMLLCEAGQEPHPTAYTAPEVRAGAAATQAADIYALGAILAELVTGAGPAPGATPDIPGDFGWLIALCMADDPAQRPTAGWLADRLGTSMQLTAGFAAARVYPQPATATHPAAAPANLAARTLPSPPSRPAHATPSGRRSPAVR